jgi:hypothetical protein
MLARSLRMRSITLPKSTCTPWTVTPYSAAFLACRQHFAVQIPPEVCFACMGVWMSDRARGDVNATAGQVLAMQFAAAYEKGKHMHVLAFVAQSVSHIVH